MMRRASLFAIAVLFLYGSPAYALTHVAPPGNSGVSQYQEDVPSAGGSVPVSNLPAAGTPRAVLPRSVVTQLDHRGTAGRGAVAVANRTAPSFAGASRRSGVPAGGSSPAVSHARAPSSLGSQIATEVIGGGGGGLGLLLPLVLVGSLIIAIALVITRRRAVH